MAEPSAKLIYDGKEIELPIVQAPVAGAMNWELAAEVAAAGSVAAVARATGVSRRAIRAGVTELKARGAAALAPGRVRRPGGAGQRVSVRFRAMEAASGEPLPEGPST